MKPKPIDKNKEKYCIKPQVSITCPGIIIIPCLTSSTSAMTAAPPITLYYITLGCLAVIAWNPY